MRCFLSSSGELSPHKFDGLFGSAKGAIEKHFGRFHPKLRARARRLADAIPAVFARQRERLAVHH
jgi:hypothetical protein